MDRISLTLSVQNVTAAHAPRRDMPSNPRPAEQKLDAVEDEYSPADLGSHAEVYDELLDRLRLAALRRDAAATAAVQTAKANTPTDDSSVFHPRGET